MHGSLPAMSGHLKGNEYFSDGISEELLNVLAKVPGLKVSARTSAFYFKGKELPIAEIAKQLGVSYVVEGSVPERREHARTASRRPVRFDRTTPLRRPKRAVAAARPAVEVAPTNELSYSAWGKLFISLQLSASGSTS